MKCKVLLLLLPLALMACTTVSPDLREATRACDQSDLKRYTYHDRNVDIEVSCYSEKDE